MEKVDPLVGKQLGNYRLDRKLGQGSCGVVYLALHIKLGTPFAVKILHPILANNEESAERFLREAQTAARLGHENVVFIADFDVEPAIGPYFVMEYLEGQNLREVLAEEPTLPIERVGIICEQICHALAVAHRGGVVHRDLKPANIFLLPRAGRDLVKILDFGIAKLTRNSDDPQIRELTRSGRILGTPRYFSPEQAQGLEIDHRSDIYSFGIILYELLAGRPPFDGKTPEEMILLHMAGDAPPLNDKRFPSELQDLINWLLAKKADERPEDMEEVWSLLKEALPLIRKVDLPEEEIRETQKLPGFKGNSVKQALEEKSPPVQRTTGYEESPALVDLGIAQSIEHTIPLGAEMGPLSPTPKTSSARVQMLDEGLSFDRAFVEDTGSQAPANNQAWMQQMLTPDEESQQHAATQQHRVGDLPDYDALEDDPTRKQRLSATPMFGEQTTNEPSSVDEHTLAGQASAYSSMDNLPAMPPSPPGYENPTGSFPGNTPGNNGASAFPQTVPGRIPPSPPMVSGPSAAGSALSSFDSLPAVSPQAQEYTSNSFDGLPAAHPPPPATRPEEHTDPSRSISEHTDPTRSASEHTDPSRSISEHTDPTRTADHGLTARGPADRDPADRDPDPLSDMDALLEGHVFHSSPPPAWWELSFLPEPLARHWNPLSDQVKQYSIYGTTGVFGFLFLWWVFASCSGAPSDPNKMALQNKTCNAQVLLKTKPGKVQVWLDKKLLGWTPYTHKGKCETTVSLVFREKHHHTETRLIHMQEGSQEVTIPLRPKRIIRRRVRRRTRRRRKRHIRIRLRTRPSRVSVYLGRRFYCRTPCTLKAPRRSVRRYTLRRRGYRTRRIKIRFYKRRSLRLRMRRRRR